MFLLILSDFLTLVRKDKFASSLYIWVTFPSLRGLLRWPDPPAPGRVGMRGAGTTASRLIWKEDGASPSFDDACYQLEVLHGALPACGRPFRAWRWGFVRNQVLTVLSAFSASPEEIMPVTPQCPL